MPQFEIKLSRQKIDASQRKRGSYPCIQKLIEYGADRDAVTNDGKSPTSVAKEMKSMGSYTMALSIFKHASSYYKNLRQEESSVSREINKEVSETSTELVRQSLASSSSSSETTTTVSESCVDVSASISAFHSKTYILYSQ